MKRKLRAVFDHPSRCILLVALLLLILAPGLFRLKIDGTTRSMYPGEGKVFDWQREFSANFATDTSLILVVRAENIFDPKAMKDLRQLAFELESLEVVKKAQHLFSIQYPKQHPGGFRLSPLIEEVPGSENEAESLRKEILSNPLLRGSLVNEAGTAAALYPTLNTDLDVPNFRSHVVETLEAFSASARERGIEVYLAGGPVIANAVIGHIWHDLFVLGPVALIAVVAMILLFFRWKVAVIFNLFTGSLSIAATFGFMGLAGIEITSLVSIIMMLVLIIGCTEDIHILSEYVLGIREGMTKADALHSMRKTVLSALFLTSISTALGFYVSAISPVPALRNFALACGTGILLNFAITILLTPVFLRIGNPGTSISTQATSFSKHLLNFCVGAVSRYATLSMLAVAAIGGIAIWGLTTVSVDNNFLNFFTKDSPVRQSHDQLEEDFGGRASLVVTIDTRKRQGVWQPETILRIGQFQDRLDTSFEHVSGFANYLREYLYQTGSTSQRERGELSLNPDQVETCRAIFGNRFLGKYLDYDGSRTAIWIRSSLNGSSDVWQAEESITRLATEFLPPEWEIRVIGEPIATAIVTDSITSELISSLFLLTAVVSVILIFYFRSWRLGLLAIIPNLFPVVVTFGFMGWVGIPIGTGTFAVAMAAFGIAVDDTIHLIVRFSHEADQKPGHAFDRIFRSALEKEIFPLLATSTTLIVGFAILSLSDFQVHRETGLLFIIAITTALLADLFLTPLVLRGIHHGQSQPNQERA